MFWKTNLWAYAEQSPKRLMIIKIQAVIVRALMSVFYTHTNIMLLSQRAVCGLGFLGGMVRQNGETHCCVVLSAVAGVLTLVVTG